jgi:hypothetical protein
MKKQTAVQWLIEQLEKEYNSFPLLNSEACIQALDMEKEQIRDAWKNGDGEFDKASDSLSELYYNETYKSE